MIKRFSVALVVAVSVVFASAGPVAGQPSSGLDRGLSDLLVARDTATGSEARADVLEDLVRAYIDRAYLSKAEQTAAELLQLRRDLRGQDETADRQAALARALLAVGDVLFAFGEFDDAEIRFAEANELADDLDRKGRTDPLRKMLLAETLSALSDVAVTRGKLEEALRTRQRVVGTLEAIDPKSAPEAQLLEQVSRNAGIVSDIANARGDQEAAYWSAGRAYSSAQALTVAAPDARLSAIVLAEAQHRMATWNSRMDDGETALRQLDGNIDVLGKIISGNQTDVPILDILFRSHLSASGIQEKLGNLEKAKSHLGHALEIAESLSAYGKTDPDLVYGPLRRYDLVSRALIHDGLTDRSLSGAADPANRFMDLTLNDPAELSWARDVVVVRSRLMKLSASTGQWAEALIHAKASATAVQQLPAEEVPQLLELTTLQATAADIARSIQRYDSALASYQDVLATESQLANKAPESQEPFLRSYKALYAMGQINAYLGNTEEAYRNYASASAMMVGLLERPDATVDHGFKKIGAEVAFAGLLMKEGRYGQAIEVYRSTLTGLEILASSDPQNQSVHGAMAFVLQELSRLPDSGVTREQALETIEDFESRGLLSEQILGEFDEFRGRN